MFDSVGGMSSKLAEFKTWISTGSCDTIILVETWFSDRIFVIETQLDGYNTYGCDRSVLTSDNLRSGGF